MITPTYRVEHCLRRARELYEGRDGRPSEGGRSVVHQNNSWVMTEDLHLLILAHDMLTWEPSLVAMMRRLFPGPG